VGGGGGVSGSAAAWAREVGKVDAAGVPPDGRTSTQVANVSPATVRSDIFTRSSRPKQEAQSNGYINLI
jgi:hypothetical protein